MQSLMQSAVCKNCESTAEGNYCSNCGQKKHTVRLDWNYLQEEIKYTFLHINKGLLYTAKQLLSRPGPAVKEFIDGKRVQHYKPILFLFVLAGLSGLLTHYLGVNKLFERLAQNQANKKMPFTPQDIYDAITNNYPLFELGLLPLISLCSWLAFRKWGYNYVENIVINSFASGLRLLITIMMFPLQFLLKDNFSAFMVVTTISGLLTMSSTIWLYIGLYKGRDLGYVILRIMLMAFYFLIIYFLAIVGFVIYLVATHKFN